LNSSSPNPEFVQSPCGRPSFACGFSGAPWRRRAISELLSVLGCRLSRVAPVAPGRTLTSAASGSPARLVVGRAGRAVRHKLCSLDELSFWDERSLKR
jgi:hypothetical protein